MTLGRVKPEKRRYSRYRPKDKVFAALGDQFSRVGKVKDISLGGVAFEYVAKEDTRHDLTRIDIFVTDNGLHLSRVPCRKVYETQDPAALGPKMLPGELMVRRCGIEFRGLSDEQTSQLQILIDTYGEQTVS